jgi:hypothetical protein
MKLLPPTSSSTTTIALIAATVAAVVSLLLSMPGAALEASPTPPEPFAQYRPSALASENDGGTWALALLGPAAILVFVTALGLTITVRSLRADVRRQLEFDR